MKNATLLILYILIGNISWMPLHANNNIKLHASHISINKGMHNIRKDHFHTITPYSQYMYYSDSCLWIGHKNTIYQWKNNTLKQYLHLPKESCTIDCTTETSQGNLYIGTKNDGIFLIDSEENITNYNCSGNNNNCISSNIVRSICEDNAGNLWIATFNGLNKYDKIKGNNRYDA